MNATPGVSGAPGPPHSAPQHSPLPTQGVALQDSGRGAGKPPLFANKRPLPACLPACLRDVHAGPWEGRHARPRPGQTRRAPGWRPARSSRTPPRRNPGPGKGFSAARGLVAPRAPPASRGGGGGGDPRKKKGRGPRAAGRPRRPQCQDAPSAPARELAPGGP